MLPGRAICSAHSFPKRLTASTPLAALFKYSLSRFSQIKYFHALPQPCTDVESQARVRAHPVPLLRTLNPSRLFPNSSQPTPSFVKCPISRINTKRNFRFAGSISANRHRLASFDHSEKYRQYSSGSNSKKSTKVFFKHKGFWILIGASAIALGVGRKYNPKVDFHLTAFSRCSVTTKAAAKIIYQYYANFPDLLSESDALLFPEEHERILAIRSATHTRCARIVRQAMLDNGGIYIKFGQHISAMSYILPEEWVNIMKPLQDACPSSTIEEVSKVFSAEMGMTLDEEFEWFDPVPIGTASLAQVHKAKLKSTGEIVAVKVQHPDVRTFSFVDISIVTEMFKLVYKVFPDFEFMWLADEMNTSLPLESDFTVEARNANKLTLNFSQRTNIPMVVPKMIASTQRVLIMEFIEGARIDDLDYFNEHRISPTQVSHEIATIFGEMIFNDGFVHCDPHPGNIFIRSAKHGGQEHEKRDKPTKKHGKNFEIVMLDHGLYRTLEKEFITDYAKLWKAMLKGDEAEIRAIGYKLTGNDLYIILSTIITGRSWNSISSGNLSQSNVNTKFTQADLVGTNDSFFAELSKVMSSVPRDLVLVTKTNDLIRLIDRSLFQNLSVTAQNHASTKSMLVLMRYCLVVLKNDALSELRSNSPPPPQNQTFSAFTNLFGRFKVAFEFFSLNLLLSAYSSWLSLLQFTDTILP